MVLNSFKEDYNKVAFNYLTSTLGVVKFLLKNPSALLTELLAICHKIDKGKYNFAELQSIYESYELPESIQKRGKVDVKPVLTYLQKLFEYLFEVHQDKSGKRPNKINVYL